MEAYDTTESIKKEQVLARLDSLRRKLIVVDSSDGSKSTGFLLRLNQLEKQFDQGFITLDVLISGVDSIESEAGDLLVEIANFIASLVDRGISLKEAIDIINKHQIDNKKEILMSPDVITLREFFTYDNVIKFGKTEGGIANRIILALLYTRGNRFGSDHYNGSLSDFARYLENNPKFFSKIPDLGKVSYSVIERMFARFGITIKIPTTY